MDRYDIIIVGAGPAGLTAAYSALEFLPDHSILIIEKGYRLEKRKCPVHDRPCVKCPVCHITQGFGGAGTFSDGKIVFSSTIGGELQVREDEKEFVRGIFDKFVDPSIPGKLYRPRDVEDITYKAMKHGMKYIPSEIFHLGTDGGFLFNRNLQNFLEERAEIHFQEKVDRIEKANGYFQVYTDRRAYEAKYVILAPGRAGSHGLRSILSPFKVKSYGNKVDLGVRVEIPAMIMEDITSKTYEPKLIYYTKQFDDRVRTFCVNPGGVVIQEFVNDVITVNGFSYELKKTENTNFAILVTVSFTEPFDDPLAYGSSILKLANLISGGVILQKLGDLRKGRRSTDKRIAEGIVEPTLKGAIPGDLAFVLPYRFLSDIIEFLDVLSNLIPGVNEGFVLLYGPEVKFYSNKIYHDVENLFIIGDGSGYTRGIYQSMISGYRTVKNIKEAEEKGQVCAPAWWKVD